MIPLLIAAAGLSAIGTVVAGANARKQAKRRARRLEEAAQQINDETGLEASLGLAEDDRTEGAALVAAGAGAGGGSRGSAMDVLGDLETQSAFKAKATIYRGQTAARNKLLDAAESRKEGRDAFNSSLLSAGSTVLSAFASHAEAKRGS